MKRLHLVLLISCVSAFIFTSPCLAVEDEDALYPSIGKAKDITYAPAEEGPDKLQTDFFASTIYGYDTNVDLEHYDPAASMFIQGAFGASARYALSDSITLKGEYDLTHINYLRFAEPDLLDNVIKAGFEADVADSLLWSADYMVDFVGYPHEKADRYTINQVETGLRHAITNSLYHKLIYKFSYTHYPKIKTRNAYGFLRMGDREDIRNTIEHRLGFSPSDKTFIKTENSIYFNNSNDVYLDYYDYTVLKTKATVIQSITEKLYGLANIGYRYKRYEDRNVSDKPADDYDQRDHLIMSGASLFYDITPAVTIGANFDYRRNISNEGEQKYTDYILSSGVYTRF